MANEWEVNYPINHTLISALPEEIRKLKASAKTQIDREHETPVDGDATGGEHSNGSAVVYRGTDTPTNRPDGVTALASNDIDKARLWIDDNDTPPVLKRWNGSAWVALKATVKASGNTVFNTSMSAANTWQTLDLSSVVGSRRALVQLRVTASSNGVYRIGIDQSGAIVTHIVNGAPDTVHLNVGSDVGFLTIMTHSDGTISHSAHDNSIVYTVTLIGYI